MKPVEKPSEKTANKFVKFEQAAAPTPTPSPAPVRKAEVSKGLVSGRTAIFENPGRPATASARNQKDPAEMSLKERMALFEKNKGTALIPKAALGMSASAKQIMGDQKAEPHKEPQKPIVITGQPPSAPQMSSGVQAIASALVSSQQKSPFGKAVPAESHASGSGIRQTVAALLSGSQTISESQISNEVRRNREQEMNVLLNRFNKDQQVYPTAPPLTPTPPPAPPMPATLLESADKCNSIKKSNNHKRRSGKFTLKPPIVERCVEAVVISDEKFDVSPQVRESLEDVKRVKINPPKNGRLYPALSDIESVTTESDNYYSANMHDENPYGAAYSSYDEEDEGENDR